MNNSPLVSIFMPVYNAEKFIIEAVESAINQSYDNIEIVISDDCSTDNTPDILYNIKSKYPNKVKLFLQGKNLGVTDNCNFLLSQCCGEFICFTAGDDMLLPNCVEKSLEYIKNDTNTAIVFHDNIKIDENSLIINGQKNQHDSHYGTVINFLKKGIYIQANGMFVRKEAIPSEGYDKSLKLASDFDFIIKILKNYNFFYTNEQLSLYRKHSYSISKSLEYECKIDILNGTLSLLSHYPQYSYYILGLISNRFRMLRKYNYENMLKTSFLIRPWNLKTLIIYLVYLASFKKIKL